MNTKVTRGIAVVMVGAVFFGLSIYVAAINVRLKNELQLAKTMITVKDTKNVLSEYRVAELTDFNIYLAEQFDVLDGIVYRVDSAGGEFISWVVDNAKFSGDDFETAAYLYGKYNNAHESALVDYNTLIDAMVVRARELQTSMTGDGDLSQVY